MPSGRRCLLRISTDSSQQGLRSGRRRTLDVSDGLVEDGLEGLGALELLLDLGDDGLGELALLPLLDLALVADPAVEDRLGLVRDGRLLLELVGLGLELGRLLRGVSAAVLVPGLSYAIVVVVAVAVLSYLGDLEQGLGDVNNSAEVLDALDALLDGLGVVGAGAVQDAGDLLGLLVGVVLPGGAGVLADGPEDGEQREGDDGLLVDDVQLVADGGDGQTGAGREHGGLGQRAVAGDGDGLHDALGLLLGVLLRGLEAGLRGDRGDGAEREGWADAGGACGLLLRVRNGRPRGL
jgi:hypothetical protein